MKQGKGVESKKKRIKRRGGEATTQEDRGRVCRRGHEGREVWGEERDAMEDQNYATNIND